MNRLCEYGLVNEALQLAITQGTTIHRNDAYYLLQACLRQKDLELSRKMQFILSYNGLNFISALGDHLIRHFACFGKLMEANQAFEQISEPSIYSWAAIISANSKLGQGKMAINLFDRMKTLAVKSNQFVYSAVLKACAMTPTLMQGKFLHHHIIRSRIQLDVTLGNTLVDMYAKCGSMEDAYVVFGSLTTRNVVSWNAIITAHVQYGDGLSAFQCLEKMQFEGVSSDEVTCLSVLKACTLIGALQQGKLIHGQTIKLGLQKDVTLGSALVDMYAKCGSLEDACKVFYMLPKHNVVSYCALISGYNQHREGMLALECFCRMEEQEIDLDEVIFLGALKACADVGALHQGRVIHEQVIRHGCSSDVSVVNTLIDMYAKSGSLEEAFHVFQKLPNRNVVSWNAIVAAHAQHGKCTLAFQCYEEIQNNGTRPTNVTYLNILKACSSMGAIQQGRYVHSNISEIGLELESTMANTLIDMYAKCGSLKEACHLFNHLQTRDVVSWNAITIGSAQHGNCMLAVQYFETMKKDGTRPDEVSFISILAACSHGGLVDEGHWYFKCMSEHYSIMPADLHCSLLADLLGRAGYVGEAENMLQASAQPNISGWTSLLCACRMHGLIELGRHYFDQVACLDASYTAGYVLMSNIYAEAYM